ncbi:tetratricopeptide repeat protein [Epilithonimonas sp. JDS]|uniref:tetratricopeptide repeat protein n=1 Tax=Epilithonimonas sp. JDS TaxID=2902797 RepID=UPI001E571AB7|nr:tetratricopeptide repeat protein [Epilithonimonas sp. JDS]MCD9855065.1 tetratricopeptide repeat protein [Epilithonimonas sp. JDS]
MTTAQNYTPKKIDSIIIGTFQLADRNQALKTSLDTYSISEKSGYYLGKAKSLKAIINSYLGLGEQQKALEAADKLLDLASSENDDYHSVQALIAKALAFSYLGFFDKANETSSAAEVLCKKVKDNDEFYSSMGQIYAGRSEIMNLQYQSPEKTIKNDLKSVEFYNKIKDPKKRNGWLAIQYSSVGYTYIDLDMHKEALYYSRKAYQLAKSENDSINQAFGMYGIGNTYLEMNQPDSSIYYYKKALPIFEKAQDIYRLQYIYDDMANIYEKLGDDRLYSYYSKKSKELYDVIRKKEKIETDHISKNIIESEKTGWYKNMYLIIAGIILFFVVKMYFTVKYVKRFRRERQRRVRTTVHLLAKEKELDQLESKVNDAFAEVLELAKCNDSSFLSRFKDVYPDFYYRLNMAYPEMTSGQLKFCAFLKLNFSTKEIAQCTHISVRSVEMKKSRLRKQLNISSDIDLNNWMMNF